MSTRRPNPPSVYVLSKLFVCALLVVVVVAFEPSPRFHRESGPVVARIDEARPTRLREEIAEAAVLGIPGLFWVFVSAQLLEYGRQTGRM